MIEENVTLLDRTYSMLGNMPADLANLIISLFLVFVWILIRKLMKRGLIRYARLKQMDETRPVYIIKVANFVLTLFLIMALTIVWNVDFKGLSVYIASIFTILGVGFFAAWSILSNVTASIILYFYFPYRIGSYIKIMEGDKPWIGRIRDISLFTIRIQTIEGLEISYPNNLILQKPVAYAESIEPLLAKKEEAEDDSV